MKSTKFRFLVLKKYISKAIDMTDKLLVKIVLVKHIVLIFSLFITAIILIFSLIKTAFLSIYENIAKRLAWYSKFENLKVL